MNIAYQYEAKNLHFLVDRNNNLPHILAIIIILLENEVLSPSGPFPHSGSPIITVLQFG